MDMKAIQALFEYNAWANARVLDAVSKLTPEQFTKEIENSFRSVRDTLVHILSAEWIWMERWKGASPKSMLNAESYKTLVSIRNRWQPVESERSQFIQTLPPQRLHAVVSYVNTRGQTFAYPLWQQMVHVANHSTYHRGQITTLLRQLGAQPVGTDFLAYYDEK